MRLTRPLLIAAIALGLTGLLAFGAFARTSDPTEGIRAPWSDGDRGPWARGGSDGWGPGHWGSGGPDAERVREVRGELAADLAAELDLPADDVEAGFRGVIAQRLDEAVDDGQIDRERADAALEAYDDGDLLLAFHAFMGDDRGGPDGDTGGDGRS